MNLTKESLLQRRLSSAQIEAFYHDEFVEDQTRHFTEMLDNKGGGVAVDIGGGCGFFALRIHQLSAWTVRVIDSDQASVNTCHDCGVEAKVGNALSPIQVGDEDVICFNLILHHIVASTEMTTRALQIKVLGVWVGRVPTIFVNEYVYESFFCELSGWLIYLVTKSHLLSALASVIATVIPSFRANTFGVGVRFRSHNEWVRLFAEAGWQVTDRRVGQEEHVALPLRLLLIHKIRRDSFVLRRSSESVIPCKLNSEWRPNH